MKLDNQIGIFSNNLLRNFIHSCSIISLDNKEGQLFLPKGVFEIIVPLNCEFEHKSMFVDHWSPWPSCFIGGLHNKAFKIRSKNEQGSYLTIKFKSNTAKNFIQIPLHQFKNSIVSITDIWEQEGSKLLDKLSNAKDKKKKLDIIKKFLHNRFVELKSAPIDWSVDYFKRNKGLIKVTTLADKIGLSTSHFRKCFNEEVGIPPSQFAKIIRVYNAANLYQSTKNLSLTELTYSMGYFDQSHFIKEFKSVTNFSPKVLKKEHYLK